ncbi:uncharacterized protein EAE98_006538 [Botrytis deweyae]|uniref:Uncharacterized protein n=1 Tax=Botrytis deweyae TaxID=2478750 RepID=A0ABQ7IJU5_9HELO|nr:uncharacterized protein EAE98_006538 [Botrytis deweyae]KAF7926243.1 hypothetical protein EAE98_006538 [Botrytis deweyae]
MCVTHIYTDCYPKRTVEFHQTIVCPNAKDGISCAALITNEHPPRILESNDELSSKEYLDQGLKVPPTAKPSPHKSTTTSTYRYSPGDKKDKSPGREPRLRLVRKKSALVSALTPRRKHPKERIVIVDAPDSPEGSKALPKYAPDSPATEEFYSKNLLVDDRSTSRRSPNGSLNPVRTVIVEHHRDQRDHSKERERPLKELPIILAPEPPSRSPSREKALVDMRIRREEEDREKERQKEYERDKQNTFELLHKARRERKREEEREREEMRKAAELERREVEYQKFLRDRELEQERGREEELLRERERARSSDRKREEELAREKEEELARERGRRRRDDELRRADEHEQKRREDQHRREREIVKALDDKEREERMRKAEMSERKAADDARRLAEQVKAFAKEDEEIRRRPSVPSRGKEVERGIDRRDGASRLKKEDDDMYARLRERQARDDGYASGLGRGASFSGRVDGDREVLDRLKERQKGPEEGYMPKRRTTIGGGSGRRRGDERIIWDDGEGGRGGRW